MFWPCSVANISLHTLQIYRRIRYFWLLLYFTRYWLICYTFYTLFKTFQTQTSHFIQDWVWPLNRDRLHASWMRWPLNHSPVQIWQKNFLVSAGKRDRLPEVESTWQIALTLIKVSLLQSSLVCLRHWFKCLKVDMQGFPRLQLMWHREDYG